MSYQTPITVGQGSDRRTFSDEEITLHVDRLYSIHKVMEQISTAVKMENHAKKFVVSQVLPEVKEHLNYVAHLLGVKVQR